MGVSGLIVNFHKAQTTIRVEETVKVFNGKHDQRPSHAVYATSEDFCRIFAQDMNRLYRLSLFLTADPELAEKCFVGGLEDSKGGNRVFKEWAQSWARRTIISNAIRTIRPRPVGNSSAPVSDSGNRGVSQLPAELAAVIALDAFERFVFVMSVLEGYPERECSLLLGCLIADVTAARIRALKQLGIPAEVDGISESVSRVGPGPDDSELALAPGLASRLAVSA